MRDCPGGWPISVIMGARKRYDLPGSSPYVCAGARPNCWLSGGQGPPAGMSSMNDHRLFGGEPKFYRYRTILQLQRHGW